MLNLDIDAFAALIASMLGGTPAVSFIGGIGAALTLRARRAGLLLALIVLPLYVPTLIFGVLAVGGAQIEGAFWPPFLIQVAVSLVAIVLAPVATAAALRAVLQ
jgi:heme exporter protein B